MRGGPAEIAVEPETLKFNADTGADLLKGTGDLVAGALAAGSMAAGATDNEIYVFGLSLTGFASVFFVGLIVCSAVRYFMSTQLPWMLRQALVMAFIYATAGTGIEMSLPKIIGTAVMFTVVYALMIKLAFPAGLRWLDNRARNARDFEDDSRRVTEGSLGRMSR